MGLLFILTSVIGLYLALLSLSLSFPCAKLNSKGTLLAPYESVSIKNITTADA